MLWLAQVMLPAALEGTAPLETLLLVRLPWEMKMCARPLLKLQHLLFARLLQLQDRLRLGHRMTRLHLVAGRRAQQLDLRYAAAPTPAALTISNFKCTRKPSLLVKHLQYCVPEVQPDLLVPETAFPSDTLPRSQ